MKRLKINPQNEFKISIFNIKELYFEKYMNKKSKYLKKKKKK